MTFADLSPLANHLWQSTLFAAVAWPLTLALRKNRASVRYWIWLAASVKFLIPFSLLVIAGAQLGWRTPSVTAPPQISFAIGEISQPFAAPVLTRLPAVPVPVQNSLTVILFGVWVCGIAIGVIFWLRSWRQIRAILGAAAPLGLNLPIPVMSSPARMGPGVVGVLKPIMLLPEGITERLTPAQLDAILAHELHHVQRQDNLTAAMHMLVETIFWFHPLVWWIRARLMKERERACDEGVLLLGNEPQVYAESILKVCEFYLASPLACAAGVTGGELKKRIEGIMANRFMRELNFRKKVLLAVVATVVVAGPIAVGAFSQSPSGNPVNAEGAGRGTTHEARPSFDVASVKLHRGEVTFSSDPSVRGRTVTGTACTLLDLVTYAYGVRYDQVSGRPNWAHSDHYDLDAKSEGQGTLTEAESRQMVQSLLEDRFQLKVHSETQEGPVYALVVGKNGPKFKTSASDATNGNFVRGDDKGLHMEATKGTIEQLVNHLSFTAGRPVLDRTGLTGYFAYTLDWYPANRVPPPDLDTPSMFAALEEQLGLRLESTKGPVERLAIDHAEKPSEN